MNNVRLALLGGEPQIQKTFIRYNPYGDEELLAATAVVRSGILSQFIGAWQEEFYGGDRVREFERAWEKFFEVPHAVSLNSATSGLIAAVGALGVEPGDEVIVSSWTMCATATSILVWNAIPVFADIETDTFNLDPVAVERKITSRTRAIVVTDIFGHAAKLDAILEIASRYRLRVVEDAAQAPGAKYHGKYVGTWADIGVYSLNYHKHIHTGEGGVCVTRDAALAERMQLIRNHGEAVAGGKGVTDLSNIIGFNFRMGEIEAAMGLAQLRKLPELAEQRSRLGARLSRLLEGLAGLQTPKVEAGNSHVYYVYSLILDLAVLNITRSRIVAALRAEGVPALAEGYVNVHRLPMFQKKIAYGKRGFPWTANFYGGDVEYEVGICPVAETLHDHTMLAIGLCLYELAEEDIDLVAAAFRKVWSNMGELR